MQNHKERYKNLSDESKSKMLWSKGKTALDDPRIGKPFESIFCENSKCERAYIKRLILSKKYKEYKCAECGITSWRDKDLVLHLDHINGKNNDNRLENLRFLCPNCHSQTSTYCNNTQNRYSDEQVIEASIGAKSINEVMLKLGASTGRNYKRFKKLLPHLVQKKEKVVNPSKEKFEFNTSEKSKEWVEKISFSNRKVKDRPTKEELQRLIEELSIEKIGKKYNVSGNAVRKWCKSYEIVTKPVGYWAKIYNQTT